MVGDGGGGGGGGGASAPSARAARAALVAWMRAGGFWWDEARLDMDADAAGEDAAARGVAARADIDAPTEEQLRHQARGSDEARQLQERPRVDGEDGSAKDGEDGGAEAQPNPEPTALAVMPLARLLTWRTCWAREMAAAAVDARDADANCSTRGSGSWVMPAAVALLAERAAGERSAWRPYVAALPDGADVPWRWEEADARALLRGTDAHALAEHIRVSARTEWERYVLPAVRKAAARHDANTAATATGPKPQGATHAGARDTRQDRAETEVDAGAGAPLEALYADEALWTLDGYLRCRSLVTSRAFNLPAPDVAGLVPGADLFNHAPVGKHTVSFQEGAAGFRLETDDGIPVECVCVAAHAAAKAGQELFLTYGPLPPAELLCHFAFVDEVRGRSSSRARTRACQDGRVLTDVGAIRAPTEKQNTRAQTGPVARRRHRRVRLTGRVASGSGARRARGAQGRAYRCRAAE